MPRTTPEIKVDAVRVDERRSRPVGRSLLRSGAALRRAGRETGMTFIHPFDDPLVIAGQGTIADEILRQRPQGYRRSSCRSAEED